MTSIRFRRLERFRTGGTSSNMKLSMLLGRSAKGWTHRYCPSHDCAPRRFQFGDADAERRLATEGASRARRAPNTPGTTCPYCGQDGDDDAFIAPEDKRLAEERVKWAAGEDIADALADMAKNFNRRISGSSFIKMSMKVDRPYRPEPRAWREDLMRALHCDVCARSYGVYAIGLFCPDCGSGNVHVHFDREVELIEKQVAISNDIAEEGDKELAYRVLANAHEDVVTALETYLKTLLTFLARNRLDAEAFESLMREVKRGNPFQRIDRATELYRSVALDPYAILPDDDRAFVAEHIEKRHVIGHNLGLADEKYVDKGGRTREGESVRVFGDEVIRFVRLAQKVVVEGVAAPSPLLRVATAA